MFTSLAVMFMNLFTRPPILSVYRGLLHIMSGYQCGKAVTKNDTREVI